MLLLYLLRWLWLRNTKVYNHLQKAGGGFEESTTRRPWLDSEIFFRAFSGHFVGVSRDAECSGVHQAIGYVTYCKVFYIL